MGSPGYTETEKIKILYEESLKDIQKLTTRIEQVSEKINSSASTVHEVEKLSRSAISEASNTFKELANSEVKRASDVAITALSVEVGMIAQKIAGDAVAADRQKSFKVAIVAMAGFAIFFYTAGALGNWTFGNGLLIGLVALLSVSIAGGIALCYTLMSLNLADLKRSHKEKEHQRIEKLLNGKWTPKVFDIVASETDISVSELTCCRLVLIDGMTVDGASKTRMVSENNISYGIAKLKLARKNLLS